MSQRPWPPNPRDAKPRGFFDVGSQLPVTILLILISMVTGALTQVGHQKEKGDRFYLSSQQHFQEYQAMYDEYSAAYDRIFEKDDGAAAPTAQELNELARWEEALKSEEAERHDPLSDVRKGQVWRLFTPMFLHFGILHLAFNMMWLWQFGVALEMRFRSMRFLALVLAVAAISNLTQGLWSGTNFGGMSGVNYGLFGFLFLRSKLHPSPGFVLNSQTVSMMLIWLVVCFTGAVGPVANAAHLAGFLGGAVIGTGNAMLAGGWQVFKRRQKFRAAVASSASTLHQCTACGKTERDDPSLEFYVSSTDDQEYCQPHLPENQS